MTDSFLDTLQEDRENSANRRIFNRVFWSLFLILIIGFSYWLGRSQAYADTPVRLDQAYVTNIEPRKTDGELVDFGLFWDAWQIVKERYVDHDMLDAQDLIYGAIDGMLGATGDPYTTFFDDEELNMFNEDLNGTFEGIGAEIGIRDGVLTIVAPLDGAPAEIAGLRAGDIIVKIDDALTAKLGIDEAVNLIRGPRGSQVVLSIYREGADDTQDIAVTRDEIVIESVVVDIEEDIAYVHIRRFGPGTAVDFYKIAQSVARNDDVKALVLDMRNNPGGYLESAVSIAGMMLPQGATVVMSEDVNDEREMFYADHQNLLGHLPTVILINEGSASASEILTGALRDNRDDVVIVGRQSFGKGSVQELVRLSQGAVKVTIAKWLTPNGDQINGVGIAPDEDVEITEEDFEAGRDPQKERAFDIAHELAQ